jgi:hypothetical protein
MLEDTIVHTEPLTLRLESRFTLVRLYHQLCVVQLQRMLTHETNNALTGLSGYAQMALRSRQEAILIKAAEVFNDGLAILQRQQQHVHFFAREAPDELSPMDPMLSVRMVGDLLTNYLSKRNIRLEITTGESGVINGNPVLLSMAILSWVWDAAGRLMKESDGGSMEIALERIGIDVSLRFRDTARQPCTLQPQECAATLTLPDTTELRSMLAAPTMAILASILGGGWSVGSTPDHPELALTIPCLRRK